LSSTTGLAVAPGDNGRTATTQGRDVVEAVGRSSALGAVMHRHQCGDPAAMRRTELETRLRVPMEGQ
jgi:hypothetical protein